MSRPSDPAVEAAAAGRVIAEHDYRRAGPRRRGRKQHARAPPNAEIDAFSIPEFCRRHGGMSEAFFHKLCRMGLGPALMRVGARTMISTEAATVWRRQREAAAKAESTV
jgi:hypothetical protein